MGFVVLSSVVSLPFMGAFHSSIGKCRVELMDERDIIKYINTPFLREAIKSMQF